MPDKDFPRDLGTTSATSEHAEKQPTAAVAEVEALQSWDRHEKQVRRAAAHQALEAERNPLRSPLHQCFRLLCLVSACAAFLMGTGQIVGLILLASD